MDIEKIKDIAKYYECKEKLDSILESVPGKRYMLHDMYNHKCKVYLPGKYMITYFDKKHSYSDIFVVDKYTFIIKEHQNIFKYSTKLVEYIINAKTEEEDLKQKYKNELYEYLTYTANEWLNKKLEKNEHVELDSELIFKLNNSMKNDQIIKNLKNLDYTR